MAQKINRNDARPEAPRSAFTTAEFAEQLTAWEAEAERLRTIDVRTNPDAVVDLIQASAHVEYLRTVLGI